MPTSHLKPGLCHYSDNTCPYCMTEGALSRVATTYTRCTKCDHVVHDDIMKKWQEMKEMMNSMWRFWADFIEYQKRVENDNHNSE